MKQRYYLFHDGEKVHEDDITEELLNSYSPFCWEIVTEEEEDSEGSIAS